MEAEELDSFLELFSEEISPMNKGAVGVTKEAGIYAIYNSITKTIYIGQSTSLFYRKLDHRWALNNNAHRNQHLQHSWNKHGAEAFTFHTLGVCEIEFLDRKEQSLIDVFFGKNCYNQSPTASSIKGFKETEEMIEKKRIRGTECWADESKREKQRQTRIQYFSDPKIKEEFIKKVTPINREILSRPEVQQKIAATKERKREEKLALLSPEEADKKRRKLASKRKYAAKKFLQDKLLKKKSTCPEEASESQFEP